MGLADKAVMTEREESIRLYLELWRMHRALEREEASDEEIELASRLLDDAKRRYEEAWGRE